MKEWKEETQEYKASHENGKAVSRTGRWQEHRALIKV